MQAGEGWLLTAEILELIEQGCPNVICAQPFACLPNHVTGRGMFGKIRRLHPEANIVSIDYDPGASEANQLNRIKLMIAAAKKAHNAKFADGRRAAGLHLPRTDLKPTSNRRPVGTRPAQTGQTGLRPTTRRVSHSVWNGTPALFVLVLFGRHRSHPSYPSLPAVNRYSASHGRSVTSIASARWLTSSS